MFLFQMIGVLLIAVTFYTYLANIVFCATWALKVKGSFFGLEAPE